MPVWKLFGIRPNTLDIGLVPTPPGSRASEPPIQIDRWFRASRAPDASVFSSMNEAVNKAILHRPKEVFGAASVLGTSSGIGLSSFGVGDRARFRWSFHTGVHHHSLLCRVVMYPQTSGFNYDSYGRLDIFTSTDETSAVASMEFHYGANPLNTNQVSGWQYLKPIDKFLTGALSPDTTYFARLVDVDYGLIQSASIVDLQSLSENNGYLPSNFTSESQILDVNRENIASLIPAVWKRNGAKVLNWTVENGTSPRTITSATHTNIIDNTSTAVSAASPGFTIDMTGKARLSQSTGVPCRIQIFGKTTAGSSNSVRVVDSSGSVVTTVGGFTSTLEWVTGSILLPDTSDKYDIMYASDGAATLSIYAISIYEYET